MSDREELIQMIRENRRPWATNSEHSKMEQEQADAILAAGWSRLVLDDAAVERAARALAGTLSVFKWEHIGPLTQEMYRDKARAVLAAAMESPDA